MSTPHTTAEDIRAQRPQGGAPAGGQQRPAAPASSDGFDDDIPF